MWAFLSMGLFVCSFGVSLIHYLANCAGRFLGLFQIQELGWLVLWPVNILLWLAAGVCICVAVISICNERK